MKFHTDDDGGFNRITAYGESSIAVNSICYRKSLVVLQNHIIEDWPVCSVKELRSEHMRPVLSHSPQIVILGTGPQPVMCHGEWMRALVEASVGFEIMSTAAACRTYNIVAAEGRAVALAVVIGEDVPEEPSGD